MSMETGLSASVEEYLEWIYRLSKEQDRVSTADLARSLKVSAPSVSNMLKRLVEKGLINHKPYQGISLTEEGRQVGARIIRRHGLLERLLCDVVGIPWHAVDGAVRHLEHYVTEEVEERLVRHLNYPTTCPHGQPLDWENASAAVRLEELTPGQKATISRIGDEEPEFLQYVASLGLLPGVEIVVAARMPFGGPLVVRVGDLEHALGQTVIHSLWVDRLSICDGLPATG
jgi:DtxR family transcriptional regulator, Mn-dependent transcriptional regulator